MQMWKFAALLPHEVSTGNYCTFKPLKLKLKPAFRHYVSDYSDQAANSASGNIIGTIFQPNVSTVCGFLDAFLILCNAIRVRFLPVGSEFRKPEESSPKNKMSPSVLEKWFPRLITVNLMKQRRIILRLPEESTFISWRTHCFWKKIPSPVGRWVPSVRKYLCIFRQSRINRIKLFPMDQKWNKTLNFVLKCGTCASTKSPPEC